MKEIDWSKAPEGTTHHVPKGYSECAECWVRLSGGLWYFHDWKNEWAPWPKPSVETVKHLFIERPKAWSGEGLPPVGTVCEVQRSNMRWYRCKIFAVRGKEALFDLESEQSDSWDSADSSCFRPIKTQEQIAAEEREKAIKEMMSLLPIVSVVEWRQWQREACERIYDYYRLTKTEE